MNELNGPLVIIVLNIREGRGFDFLQNPLYIEASLKDSKIQSDAASPDPTPSICTELVWETQKREVRKLRSSHVPLRVDCFTVNADQQKERIGFIMLSLRSAQAVAGNQVSPVEHKWHKLVGVPSEYKVCHPELAITLTVRDRCYHEMQTMHPAVNTCVEQVLCEELVHTDSDRPVIVPIMYLEDGCIRIGENCPDLQRFTLTVHIGTAINLDLLLPASKVFQENKEKYCISISILGMAINTKNFYKNLHEPIVLNDRVAIKLESTAQILKLFFDQYQYVPVHFCHGKEVLASTEIDFNGFFIIEQLENNTACRKEQDCLFHIGDAREIPSGVDERKPAVSVETALSHYQNNTSTNSNASVSNSVDSFNNNSADSMDDTKHAGGDQKRQHDESKTPPKSNKSIEPREDAAVQTTPRVEKIVAPTVLKTVLKKSQSRLCSNFNGLASYHLFDLTVTFCSITWRKSLELERVVFKFQHPKASNAIEIPCTLNAKDCNQIITLDDVLCKMNYISTEENIRTLISMYPVLVSLCKANGDHITDEFQVYTKLFLSQTEDECVYYAVLNAVNDKDDLLCDLQIQMTINDRGISLEFENPSDEFQLDPIILDDWFAVKMIKDLKEWKETQERLFMENLNRLQNEKLECLQSDWRNKRVILERKLQDGLENCKVLYQQLSLTASEMKLQSAFCQRIEPCTMNSRRDDIEMRVTQMLEEEMNMTVRRIEREKEEMAEKMQVLSKEKSVLEKTMQANLDELTELRKTTLTQSQTASLFQEIRTLEEKYQQALATKTFFKEQWQKTLNEVHALKCEDQRQIQQEIQRKKEELSQFNIDELDSVFCTAERENTFMPPGLETNTDVPVESFIF